MEEAQAAPMIEIHNFDEFVLFSNLGEDIFQFDFKPMNKAIVIKCHNTNVKNNNNEVYIYNLSKDEIIKVFDDYSYFIDELKANAGDSLKLQKLNNSLFLTILLGQNNQVKILTLPLQIFNEEDEIEECDINNLQDIIKIIKKLLQENKSLKKQINTLLKIFEDYNAKMELNFEYNSLYSKAFKLDLIYQKLPSKDIIQNKLDFSLINQGIQRLFQKNIFKFELKYKSENLKFECEKFYEKLNNSEYKILMILTQDKRRFGAFFKRNVENQKIDKNEINNLDDTDMDIVPQYTNVNQINQNAIYPRKAQKNYISTNSINYRINNYQTNIYQNYYNFNNRNVRVQGDTIDDPTDSRIIFDSSKSERDYYVFSLDSSQIFYSNNYFIKIIPSFSIGLTRLTRLNREILFGIENSSRCMLSGSPEFDILEIELYSIQY